jgi:hypothetical protein
MGTLAISPHRWRRPHIDRQLFMVFICLGFITIGLSRHLVEDELRQLRAALKRLRGDKE